MSNVETSTHTVIQHRFAVPCPAPWGGNPSDLGLALHLAKAKAEELGVDTHCDDWCRIDVEDEALVLVITETTKEPQ